jgi:hypothetical protein
LTTTLTDLYDFRGKARKLHEEWEKQFPNNLQTNLHRQATSSILSTFPNSVPLPSLPDFADKNESPPKKLIDPDNQEHKLDDWNDILKYVVQWLVKNNLLTENDLPLQTSRSTKRYLISSKPKHKDGRKFLNRIPVVNDNNVTIMWIEAHDDRKRKARMAAFLAEKYGKDYNFKFIQ